MKSLPLLILFLLLPLTAATQEFTLHQQKGSKPGPTLLVVGGIQGDEPGGFNAAALLATRYRIGSGELRVVPNLNFSSIIERSRGLHGDMNRKFETLPTSDPEYAQVSRIKQIITDPQVDMVLNLHDGSGFYAPDHIDDLRNPQRWGQSCIIDQRVLPGVPYGELEKLGQAVIGDINRQVLHSEHLFCLKNTETGTTETEMKQSLSYFAVRHNKPAFGIEVSKTFPTHLRTYYHLVTLEAYLRQLGIEYSRDFQLTPEGVDSALQDDILISFGNGRIQLGLDNLRPTLKYFPLPKNRQLQVHSNNPLVAVVPNQDLYRIHYGNNRLSFLNPQYFDYDDSLAAIEMLIDGHQKQVPLGSQIAVGSDFLVHLPEGYRVNVIGYRHAGQKNESEVRISKQQIDPSYSIDRDGQIYRVEVYRQDRFNGMILVDFGQHSKPPLLSMTRQTTTSNN